MIEGNMFFDYLKTFFLKIFKYSLACFLIFLFLGNKNLELLIVIGIIFVVIASFQTHQKLSEQTNIKLNETLRVKEEVQKEAYANQKEAELWKSSLLERNKGFSTLINAIQEYEKLKDESLSDFLSQKKHPAMKASEVIREETRRRREAESARKRTQAILEYYEYIAPFLADYKDDIVDFEKEDVFREYNEEELQDPTIRYLTKEEFRELPSVIRNQLALDRFWKRPKSKWLLGRLYERYIGYLYEQMGYEVEYVGIFKGYEDLGRDLICQKGNDFIVIQCKNWSQFKTIYEKHIFQFFGTVFQYRDSYPERNIKAIFYTATQVSELARRFADELGIELKENFKLDQSYPCIKCNISRATGERIYHLPFDQQYDKTKIEKKRGEFYCTTVKEAEEAEFRRAFKWRGAEQKS